MKTVVMGWHILDRMERAVAKVRERLLKVSVALEEAGIDYAVVGGNAVATWVSTVDEEAVRNTRDVDLLIRRSDLPAVASTLERKGFIQAEVLGVVMFLDGPEGKPSAAIHLLFAGEKAQPDHSVANPELITIKDPAGFRVIELEGLVRMKLTSHRDKDRMHIRDLIAVGLLDATWLPRLPPELAARLQQILDTPEG